MIRYFFMVRLPKDANLALVCGRCISIMHGFVCRHGINGLGVSFPAWSDVSIGNFIAFVHSDTHILKELQCQHYFQHMKNEGLFLISHVEPVPIDCDEVRFKRNQSLGKMFAGDARRRLKRLERRALERGEVFKPKSNTSQREFDTFHRVMMNSSSNREDYIIHIQKDEVEKPLEPLFCNYGLATNELYLGTVPDLSLSMCKFYS